MANIETSRATLSERAAEEIRALLARRRISGRTLANALNVSPSWVSYRLTGTQPIDLNDLERIAEYLEVDVTDLLPPRREGHIVPSRPAHETRAFPKPPIGQAKAPIPAGPKGGVRRADDKLRVPPSSRRPGRTKSTVRVGGRVVASAERPGRDISTVANLMDVS